jgi:hypothetical protein
MSYFIEHGIQESSSKSRFSNPDVSEFMSQTSQAFEQFQSLQQMIGNSSVLQQMLEVLVQDLEIKQQPLCASKAFLANLETLENLQGNTQFMRPMRHLFGEMQKRIS